MMLQVPTLGDTAELRFVNSTTSWSSMLVLINTGHDSAIALLFSSSQNVGINQSIFSLLWYGCHITG